MKKSQMILGSLAALALTSWVTSAMAETTPASGTSTVLSGSVLDTLSGSFATSLLAGPAITDPLAHCAPDTKVGRGNRDESAATFLRSGVGLGLKLNDAMSVGPSVAFDMNTFSPGTGPAFTLLDPYLKLSHSKLINSGNLSGNLNLAGSVRLYAPSSEGSQKAGVITVVRSDQSLSYTISDSRFSLRLDTFIAGNVVRKAVITDEKGVTKTLRAMTVYAGPSVSFQATPTLAPFILGEMGASKNHGTGLTDFYTRTDYTNLATGVSWDIMPGMNFSPALAIPVGQRIALDTTSLYFDFSWKFL